MTLSYFVILYNYIFDVDISDLSYDYQLPLDK